MVKRIWHSKKGMTMIEVMVTLAVIIIVIPTVGVCLLAAMKQLAWTKAYADLCSIVSAVDSTVERELAMADDFVSDGEELVFYKSGMQIRRISAQEVVLDTGDIIRILYIDDTPVFAPAFYRDVSITAAFEILPGGTAVKVTLIYSGVGEHNSTFLVERF